MPVPTIVFDLDGTLIDTAPDLVGALNALFVRDGRKPVPFETARNMIGAGGRRLIERGLMEQNIAVSASELERLFEDFLEHYAAHIADHSRPYPGLEGALDRLAAQGFRLAVCTNKLEWLSVRLLGELKLAQRFAAICGQDTFGIAKPDPEMLRRTVAKAGGKPDQAVMVGDSANDIEAARAAGIPVVAVDFGYTEIPVTELGPDRIISRFEDLPAAVEDLLAQVPAKWIPVRR